MKTLKTENENTKETCDWGADLGGNVVPCLKKQSAENKKCWFGGKCCYSAWKEIKHLPENGKKDKEKQEE